MKYLISIILVFISINLLYSQINEVRFTLDDRDCLIRVEEQVKALTARIDDMNLRIYEIDNRMNNRIDDLKNLIYVVIAGIFVLIGFVIWDRRSTVAPVARDIRKIKAILEELSEKNTDLKEILKRVAL
ncbi:MAG: hypothetical protein HY738_16985 [Bacteroidia bacterium]|nr:hypothetical protein [Bacteroidia bacterium]